MLKYTFRCRFLWLSFGQIKILIVQDDVVVLWNNDDTFEERCQKYNKNQIIKDVYEIKRKIAKNIHKLDEILITVLWEMTAFLYAVMRMFS